MQIFSIRAFLLEMVLNELFLYPLDINSFCSNVYECGMQTDKVEKLTLNLITDVAN